MPVGRRGGKHPAVLRNVTSGQIRHGERCPSRSFETTRRLVVLAKSSRQQVEQSGSGRADVYGQHGFVDVISDSQSAGDYGKKETNHPKSDPVICFGNVYRFGDVGSVKCEYLNSAAPQEPPNEHLNVGHLERFQGSPLIMEDRNSAA